MMEKDDLVGPVSLERERAVTSEKLVERIRKDLSRVSAMSTVEVVNAVYASLDRIADQSRGVVSVDDVTVKPISPEEKLLREIHEEPRDEVEFEFKLTLRHPLKYIRASFVIDPKNC